MCLLQVFDIYGKFLRKFGGRGGSPGQFGAPYGTHSPFPSHNPALIQPHTHARKHTGIALDRAGNVFVGDCYNDRVQIFDPRGKPLLQIAASSSGRTFRLHYVSAVFVDAFGRVFVGDCNENVLVFVLSSTVSEPRSAVVIKLQHRDSESSPVESVAARSLLLSSTARSQLSFDR